MIHERSLINPYIQGSYARGLTYLDVGLCSIISWAVSLGSVSPSIRWGD